MNELIQGLTEGTRELQQELESLVASMVKVEKLFDGNEPSEPPSELEKLLRIKVQMMLMYVTLLQVSNDPTLLSRRVWHDAHAVGGCRHTLISSFGASGFRSTRLVALCAPLMTQV